MPTLVDYNVARSSLERTKFPATEIHAMTDLLRSFQFVCLVLLVALASSPVMAEKNAVLDLKLGETGDITLKETFDGSMPKPFQSVKGEWTVQDGSLSGKELASDQHAAVMNVQKKNRDSVVRVSFQFEGATKGFNFSLNHKGGHLFRVVVAPSGLRVNLDKDKKDPASKAVALGSAKVKFKAGEWYTLQVEMKGERVVAQTDNGAIIEISHAKLDTDKPNYRFVMKGDSLKLDDLMVWDWK